MIKSYEVIMSEINNMNEFDDTCETHFDLLELKDYLNILITKIDNAIAKIKT